VVKLHNDGVFQAVTFAYLTYWWLSISSTVICFFLLDRATDDKRTVRAATHGPAVHTFNIGTSFVRAAWHVGAVTCHLVRFLLVLNCCYWCRNSLTSSIHSCWQSTMTGLDPLHIFSMRSNAYLLSVDILSQHNVECSANRKTTLFKLFTPLFTLTSDVVMTAVMTAMTSLHIQ